MVGAGYVGLVSAACFAEFGWTVLDLEDLRRVMRGNVIVDLRNVYVWRYGARSRFPLRRPWTAGQSGPAAGRRRLAPGDFKVAAQ